MIRFLLAISLVIIFVLTLSALGIFDMVFSNLIYQLLPLWIIISGCLFITAAMIKRRLLLMTNLLALVMEVFLFVPVIGFGGEMDTAKPTLEVTSFNASFFKLPRVYSKDYWSNSLSEDARDIENYVKSLHSDVICIQEFFDDSLNTSYSYLNHFVNRGYDYMFLRNPKHDNGISRGLIILTKHRIINKGPISLSSNNYNGIAFTDILWNSDTLRIINVHLESMELRFRKKSITKTIPQGFREWARTTRHRSLQIDQLNSFISKSNHKIILAGDFNELPYSYNLSNLNGDLSSTFQACGKGFGRTLTKSKLPVRIDHQFYSDEILPVDFRTRTDVKGSDHYPIECNYSLLN